MDLGEQIKKHLKAKGITQNELARRAGMSSSGMSTIINGSYDPRLSSLRAIAAELECSVSDLISDQGAARGDLSVEELRLLTAWRRTDPMTRKYALEMLEAHPAQEKAEAVS